MTAEKIGTQEAEEHEIMLRVGRYPGYRESYKWLVDKSFPQWVALLESYGAEVKKLPQVTHVRVGNQLAMWYPTTGKWHTSSKSASGEWFYQLHDWVAKVAEESLATVEDCVEPVFEDQYERAEKAGFAVNQISQGATQFKRGLVRYELDKTGYWKCLGNSAIKGKTVESLMDELERVAL
jgi:hypothetical protein